MIDLILVKVSFITAHLKLFFIDLDVDLDLLGG